MDYKVQFKSYDVVANTTKVAIKQNFPYRVFEESLPNNRTNEDDATLVEAVLNIVRMELDTSGAVVAIKKELDKSVEANNDAIAKIQALTKDNEEKANQIQKIKEVAEWNVLARVTDVENPLDPTVFKRGLELVDLGETGKTYQPQEIFTIEDPNHTEAFGEGKRIMIQVNEPFTYQGETLDQLDSLYQNGKIGIWKWTKPKEEKSVQPSGDLETQPVATATPQPLI